MNRVLFILIYLLVLAQGCRKPGCIGKAGAVTTRQADPGEFNSVKLLSNIDLVLVQGTSNKLEISGPSNILPEISFIVTDGVLTLNNEASCRWARDPDERISVRLTFTSLVKLAYEGSGNVTNEDTLKLDGLLVESYEGAGDVELTVDNGYTGVFSHLDNPTIIMHGSSDRCNTYTSARGITDLADFRVKNMVIDYGGLADTRVNVSETLDVILYYKGNVYYKGNPVVRQLGKYSTGEVIRIP